MADIVFPNYNKSILNITSSILKYYNADTDYNSLKIIDDKLKKSYKNIVLMVFDAMGTNIVNKNLSKKSILRKNICDEVTSVFPSTTAAAMPVFYSGLPPISNGWLSSMCYFKEYDRVIVLYRNQDFYTREILEGKKVQDDISFETIYSKIVKATKGSVIVKELSPFNESNVSSIDEICCKILEQCANGENNFILSYWPNPDAIMHEKGISCDQVKENLLEINKSVDELFNKIDDQTLLIITADHGHIDIEEEIYINEYYELESLLKHPLSFEDRTVSVFVKDGKQEKFRELFNELFENDFLILNKSEVFNKNLFGFGPEHPRVRDFVGDFLIIAIGKKNLRQHLNNTPKLNRLNGSHAGLLKDEMMVPVILLSKL